MAHLKHTPKTYESAAEVLQGRDSIKLGNNTWLERIDSGIDTAIAVRLHNTYIVRFQRNGEVTLHTGGYRTVTTKERLNQFTSKRIYQKNHQWFVVGHTPGGYLDWTYPQPFVEGINVA